MLVCFYWQTTDSNVFIIGIIYKMELNENDNDHCMSMFLVHLLR